jgi:non-specific serine/threonine protein kinase
VDKSLVIMEERDGAARYRMLETIRQYAAEKLDEATRRRHSDYWMAVGREALAELSGPRQAQWLGRLDIEQDNLRAALDFARGSEAGLELAMAVARYLFMRGSVVEALGRLERVIAQVPPAAPVPPRSTARVLNYAGYLAIWRGEMDKARQYLERALAMAQEAGDRQVEASALRNLGTLAKEMSDFPRALELFTQVLDVDRGRGDQSGIAGALNNMAITRKLMGEPEAARKLLEESLAIRQELGDATWAAYTQMNLGELAQEQADAVTGRRWYDSALVTLRELRDDWGIACAYLGLGKCALLEEDVAEARHQFESALAIAVKVDDKKTLADLLDCLARVDLRLGDSSAAWPRARQAFVLRRQIRDQLGLAQSLETLAGARSAVDAGDATRLLGVAEGLRTRLGAPLTPARQREHDELVERLKGAMGAEAFSATFSTGQGVKGEEVAASILSNGR